MSMMSEKLMPSACEVDVTGVATMYALQLASGTPSALVDWNNNYGDDPNKCVFFHCGNWAKSFLPGIAIKTRRDPGHDAGRGEHLRRGGRARAGRAGDLCPHQHRRRQRLHPHLRGRGRVHRRPAATPSAAGPWWRCPSLQKLMRYICKNGFEHHVAMNALARRARPGRGIRDVPGLGGVSPRCRVGWRREQDTCRRGDPPRLQQMQVGHRARPAFLHARSRNLAAQTGRGQRQRGGAQANEDD